MPFFSSVLSTKAMEEYLGALVPSGEPLLFHDELTSSSEPRDLAYDQDATYSPYPLLFGGSAGSDFSGNPWLDAPSIESIEPSQLYRSDMKEFENSQIHKAKRLKPHPSQSSKDSWYPVIQPQDGMNSQKNFAAHQARCQAATELGLDTYSESSTDPSRDEPPQHLTDLPSQRNSYQEPLTTRPSLKRSSTASAPDIHIAQTSSTTTMDEQVPPTTTRQAKTSHCQVERKYRENLNTKFETLRRTIPSMQLPSTGYPPCEAGDLEDCGKTVKPRKADILSGATDYVKQLEDKNSKMGSEIDFLRSRVKAIEKLINCKDCYLLKGIQNMRVDPPAACGNMEWME